jgi:2-methylcitrate dehydratase
MAMTLVEEMGEFVARSAWEDVSEQARELLKIRVLDSIGCALGALAGEPVKMVRAQIDDFGGSRVCSLIGGGRTFPRLCGSVQRREGCIYSIPHVTTPPSVPR